MTTTFAFLPFDGEYINLHKSRNDICALALSTAGHALDVVITQCTSSATVLIDSPLISDPLFITSGLHLGACIEPRAKQTTVSKRLWNELDVDAFRRDIL